MYLKTEHTLGAYIRTAPKGDGKNETVQAFAAQIIPGRSHTPHVALCESDEACA